MHTIHAVLVEPVGCLAEFPAKEFDEIAARFFGDTSTHDSGSEAFWRSLDLLDRSGSSLEPAKETIARELEIQAIDQVELYEDVRPALSQLKEVRIQLLLASSLSNRAARRFLERFSLEEVFTAVWDRDSAGGIKAMPLLKAMESASLRPEHVITLVDTVEGLEAARDLGTNSILMFTLNVLVCCVMALGIARGDGLGVGGGDHFGVVARLPLS